MNLIYIVGKGSKWNDNELRYSLRSVAMFGRNVGTVLIVGDLPPWVQHVTHIPAKDPYGVCANNTWHKLAIACSQVDEPFVLMNDDFFLHEAVDFDILPMYYDGTIDELLSRYHRNSMYKQCQQNTQRVLQNAGYKQRNYALHVPVTIQPEKLLALHKLYGEESGLSLRNMYGNMVPQDNQQAMSDVKLNEAFINRDDIDKRIGNAPFFSIGDMFLNGVGTGYLKNYYPYKCKYEK